MFKLLIRLIIKYKPSIDKLARIIDIGVTARSCDASRRGAVSVRCGGMTSCNDPADNYMLLYTYKYNDSYKHSSTAFE